MALCLIPVLGGCGGSDSEGATTESLSKAEFIKAADAICKKSDQIQGGELKAYVKANPKAESSKAGQIKLVEAAGLPAVRTEIEELSELGTVRGSEAEADALIKEMEKALGESEDEPEKVLKASANPFASVEQRAAKFGFKECNSPL